jgi:hypothetical protein
LLASSKPVISRVILASMRLAPIRSTALSLRVFFAKRRPWLGKLFGIERSKIPIATTPAGTLWIRQNDPSEECRNHLLEEKHPSPSRIRSNRTSTERSSHIRDGEQCCYEHRVLWIRFCWYHLKHDDENKRIHSRTTESLERAKDDTGTVSVLAQSI